MMAFSLFDFERLIVTRSFFNRSLQVSIDYQDLKDQTGPLQQCSPTLGPGMLPFHAPVRARVHKHSIISILFGGNDLRLPSGPPREFGSSRAKED